MHAAKFMCSAKHLKKKFWWLNYKITQKSTPKDFLKTSSTYFLQIFLLYFSKQTLFKR